jgi:two-component system chemotaxis response regulator CheY
MAPNGREAISRIRNESPRLDLLLVDWNMPEMNGLQFVKELRRESAYRSVPLVMVTTETEMSQMTAALDAGADEYVMKPFTEDVLLDKLRLVGALPCEEDNASYV